MRQRYRAEKGQSTPGTHNARINQHGSLLCMATSSSSPTVCRSPPSARPSSGRGSPGRTTSFARSTGYRAAGCCAPPMAVTRRSWSTTAPRHLRQCTPPRLLRKYMNKSGSSSSTGQPPRPTRSSQISRSPGPAAAVQAAMAMHAGTTLLWSVSVPRRKVPAAAAKEPDRVHYESLSSTSKHDLGSRQPSRATVTT